jgi:tryptophan halogenase
VQDTREQTPLTGIRADAVRAAVVDHRIAIDFGRGMPNAAPGDETVIALSNRILLDPPTVARLISALQEVARRQATVWSDTEAEPVAQVSRAPTRSHAEPDEAGTKAALMIRLMKNLGCPYYHERSFRMSPQSLAANRFLLTANTKSVAGDLQQAMLAMCERLSMPGDLQQQVEAALPGAKAIHFGFEGDDRILYKVYLERRDAFDESRGAAPGTPVLLHVAYKWDSNAPEQRAISRYRWYPHLSAPQVLERIAAIYGGDRASPSFRIAQEVLQTAASGMNEKSLQYLEVQEDGNERLSYDLNVYDAGLQLKDVQPQLARMREQFEIRPGQFQTLYDQIKTRILGHLAGGIHRNGREFFNVYYGVQRYKG